VSALKFRNVLHLSYAEVAEAAKTRDTIILPIGSCEKHGAHVPLGTDTFITQGVVERAAELADVMHTPIIPVGYSPHHMGEVGQLTGTLTFSAPTYNAVLYDLGRSLIFHGFNRLIYATHHGSNTKLIDGFMRRLRYETNCFVCYYKTPTERECHVVADIIEGPPEETPGWHAGEIETAMIMAVDPRMVDMQRAKQDRAHAPTWMGPAFSKRDGMPTVIFQGAENVFVPMEHHEYSDTATIGNPFRGTPEKGKKLFERGARHLADFVEEVKKIPVKVTRRDFPERASW
jgi:creatinine amidohydrolase